MNYCRISGVGHYLPKKRLTNKDLEKTIDTSEEWIRERTGIESRYIANENELPSDMALYASLKALEQAQIQPEELDLILVANLYPDQLMPNTSCELQRKLGISCTPALDISAACSGFVYAFSIASQYVHAGTYKHILVVGTETLHHVTDYEDRSTCILFGDSSGAVVVSQNIESEKGCVYHQELKAYGELGSLLLLSSPGARQASLTERGHKSAHGKKDTYIQMDGRKVFKKAVEIMCSAYQKTLKDTSKAPEQIDWLVPHQANERILQAFCKNTGFPIEKMIIYIKDMGNTSAASIPTSFSRAVEQGKIKRGQNILMIAVGGGMTSGSIFLRY